MSVVKLPQMTEDEIKKVIDAQDLCRIAFIDENYPYIAPFQYIYVNNSFYFHFTDYGKKKEILEKNNKVAVSLEQFSENLNEFYFITYQGELILITDQKEIEQILKKMVNKARENYSENFISVHGFDKEKGWESFETKNQKIYKLGNIVSKIGLKSIH